MQIFEKVPMTKAMISLGAVVKKKFTRIFIMTNVSNNRGGGRFCGCAQIFDKNIIIFF